MNFLPGWFPAGAVNAELQIQLTHISTTPSSGTDLTFPASGIEAGDLLVYIAGGSDSSLNPPTINLPTDFTEIMEASGTPGGSNATRARAGYKVAVGDEDGTVFNMASGASITEVGVLLQYRPNASIGSVSVLGTDSEITSGSIDPQALGSGINYNLHVALYYAGVVATISPRTYSPAEDAETHLAQSNANCDAYVKWKLMNPPSTAVEVTADMDDEGSINVMVSFILLVEP